MWSAEPGARLTLLVAVLAATVAAAGADSYKNENCADVTEMFAPAAVHSPRSALRVEGAGRALWALWRTPEERAAAALLLRAVAAHARCAALRCDLALCRLPPGGLCELLAAHERRRQDGGTSLDLDDVLVAGFVPAQCDAARQLSELSAGVPPPAPLQAPLVTEKALLQRHAPWLVDLMRRYRPSAAVLADLLNSETGSAAPEGGRALGASAARAARAWAAAHRDTFRDMHRDARRSERYLVCVYACRGDERDAVDAARAFRDAAGPQLPPPRFDVAIEVRPIDCLSASELTDHLHREARTERGSGRLLGAAVVGAGVARAALAPPRGVALVAYDAQPAGPALLAGAEAAALGRALAAALAACGWRRVAVLSEAGAAAGATVRALAAARPGGALRLAALSPLDAELSATLRALRAEDARVLVVNAGGAGAARALRLGAAAGLTVAADRAWLLREWPRASPPPAELRPLRALSAGGARAPRGALAGPGRAGWPARSAPLLDALATLAFGSARLFAEREEYRYDHRTEESLRSFLSSVSRPNASLPGVESDFAYDSRGVRSPAPAVRLEVWPPGAGEPRALVGDLCAVPRVRDASRPCLLPVGGDAFAPRTCLGALAAAGAPALLLAALLARLAARALLRRAAARELASRRRERALAGAELLQRQPGAGPELVSLLVERERVALLGALGAGRHGRVWLARLEPGGAPVAAKGPHADAAPAEEGELLREAALLAPLRHAHVLRLLGVCVGPGPPLLLSAVAAHGDLRRYLRLRRPPGGSAPAEAAHASPEALTRLLREAALALAYLAARGIVHRDVRAANCLVDERRELRLADFGMARELGAAGSPAASEDDRSYSCRRRALLPVLWMAPESLSRGTFSPASDVWALGVLALELVTLGARPFGSLSAARAMRRVLRGGRARLPAQAAAETRALTAACWRGEAQTRPGAAQVARWLARRPAALQACPPSPSPSPSPSPPPSPDAPSNDDSVPSDSDDDGSLDIV